MKKLFLLFFLFFVNLVHAQNLPAGYIGRVLNNTAGTWQPYSFNFVAGTTGSNYFMLAFRQDPAYWSVDNITLKAAGSSTNLLTNGDMSTGGGVSVNNGQQYIQAPTAWGVAYQNGTYPAAAGFWTGGMWYDGAVGSFDAIYQAVRLTAGVTYTLEFMVKGDHTATTTTTQWQLGVYAGACGNVGLAPTECTLPSSAGFTQLATPGQTYTAGCTTDCPVNPDAGPTFDGTITQTNASGSTYSSDAISGPATDQETRINTWNNVVVSGNVIYIENRGTNNTVTISQSGGHNLVTGVGQQYALINGVSNTLTVVQGGSSTGSDRADIKIIGDLNNVSVMQSVSTVGIHYNSTNGHYQLLDISGNNNTYMGQQSNDGGSGKHFSETKITGSNNTINNQQISNSSKALFTTVNGNYNNSSVMQSGLATHYADINLSGASNTVDLQQTGNTANRATITLTNAGGSSSIDIQQTGGKSFNIQQTCTVPAGCSTTVRQ